MRIRPSMRHACALTLMLLSVAAQSVRSANSPQYILDPSFNAPLFTARAVGLRSFVMPDDRFLVAGGSGEGAFQRVDGEVRGNLFRCNADGTRDHTFALDPQLRNFTVSTVAPAAGNKIYVACVPPPFLGGPDRVFRLNDDGSLDPSFDAGPGTAPDAAGVRCIRSILVDQFGRVTVGGQFADFSNSGHANLVRLTSTGAVDSGFAAVNLQTANNAPTSISPISHMGMALQPDGKLVITGLFSSVNGVARAQVARLHSDGSLDTGFVPSGYGTSNTLLARCVAIQPDGKVVVGGSFRAPSPVNAPVRVLIRLEIDGARDTSFATDTGGSIVRALKILQDGSILIATTATRPLLRFASNGISDQAFRNNTPTYATTPTLHTVDTQSDGRIIFSGAFQFANGQEYHGYARLNQNGTLEPTLQHSTVLERETMPGKIAARSDGKIMVTGDFDRVNGVTRVGAALLNPDGSLGGVTFPAFVVYFTPGPPGFFLPPGFLLLPNDQTLFFGRDPNQGGAAMACRRINPDGSDDANFSFPAEVPSFDSMLAHGSGYLLSAGLSAQSIVDQILLRRVLDNGSLDEAFLFGVDLVVRSHDGILARMYVGDNRALAALPGDKVLYKFFDGANYQLLRLEADSFPDESFNEGTAAPRGTFLSFPFVFDPYDPRGPTTVQPYDGAVQPTSLGPMCVLSLQDGRLILGGEFISYNGAAAGGLAQLSADGALLSTFGSGVSFASPPANPEREPSVRALEFEETGRILALGDFDRYNGTAAPGLVRIDADGNRDLSFAPPVVPRTAGAAFTETPLLAREAGGSFLLVGNYAPVSGSTAATSIFRLLPVPVAVSRKAHGEAGGVFEVTLPFAGMPGVESRNGGPGGNHQIAVTFPAAVTFSGASVTSGTGSVSNAGGSGTPVLTLDLTGVANQQTISVTIMGVNDGATTKDVVIRMGALVGDTNGDGAVNAGDALQTRNRSGQMTDGNNFRNDVNLDGNVNSGDALLVRGRSGNSL